MAVSSPHSSIRGVNHADLPQSTSSSGGAGGSNALSGEAQETVDRSTSSSSPPSLVTRTASCLGNACVLGGLALLSMATGADGSEIDDAINSQLCTYINGRFQGEQCEAIPGIVGIFVTAGAIIGIALCSLCYINRKCCFARNLYRGFQNEPSGEVRQVFQMREINSSTEVQAVPLTEVLTTDSKV